MTLTTYKDFSIHFLPSFIGGSNRPVKPPPLFYWEEDKGLKLKEELMTTNFIKSIDTYKSRRALTLAFNDGQAGIIYADVLVYLTLEYLSQIKNNSELLESHDGFMVKTPKDAELEIGISADRVRLVYKGLESAGVITIKTKGQDNRTCLKVNLDMVESLLETYTQKFDEIKSAYVQKQEDYHRARKEQSQKRTQSKIDFDKVNSMVEENNPKELGTLSDDYEALSLIYIVNHYYKVYTGKNYHWEAVKFNTLMTTWRNRSSRVGSEFGLSYALFTELNNHGFGSKRPFELRVRERFNPDIQPRMFDSKDYAGVAFDNLMRVNL